MTKTPISLQDLRRSLYVKAKAEPTWRFWGLYVHVCKMETLREAYQMAKSNDGALERQAMGLHCLPFQQNPICTGTRFDCLLKTGSSSQLTGNPLGNKSAL